MNRRQFLQSGAAGIAAMSTSAAIAAPAPSPLYQDGLSPWPFVLNASTIRPTPLVDKIRVAHETGWDGIELWVRELEEYEQAGGNLKELGQDITERGMYVPNVIGLWDSIPATQEEFDAMLPTSRERMRMCADVGSKHVAVLPFPDREDYDHYWGAARYADLLKISRDEYGVIGALEFVGFTKGVNRLGFASGMAIDANDKDACIIADTFHLWRGGSGFNGIRHLNGKFIADFHWNDVGPEADPNTGGDADRIYPGDGILPLDDALQQLAEIGYTGPLSLELFNRAHWESDPVEVAATGLEKMRANVRSAMG